MDGQEAALSRVELLLASGNMPALLLASSIAFGNLVRRIPTVAWACEQAS